MRQNRAYVTDPLRKTHPKAAVLQYSLAALPPLFSRSLSASLFAFSACSAIFAQGNTVRYPAKKRKERTGKHVTYFLREQNRARRTSKTGNRAGQSLAAPKNTIRCYPTELSFIPIITHIRDRCPCPPQTRASLRTTHLRYLGARQEFQASYSEVFA